MTAISYVSPLGLPLRTHLRAGSRETVEQKLNQLRAEYAAGEAELNGIRRQESEMNNTLLRIAAAIQVLEDQQRSGG